MIAELRKSVGPEEADGSKKLPLIRSLVYSAAHTSEAQPLSSEVQSGVAALVAHSVGCRSSVRNHSVPTKIPRKSSHLAVTDFYAWMLLWYI